MHEQQQNSKWSFRYIYFLFKWHPEYEASTQTIKQRVQQRNSEKNIYLLWTVARMRSQHPRKKRWGHTRPNTRQYSDYRLVTYTANLSNWSRVFMDRDSLIWSFILAIERNIHFKVTRKFNKLKAVKCVRPSVMCLLVTLGGKLILWA